jgi:hypothetical protein
VITAHRELQRLERQAAAVAELPIAQLVALTANLNRDTVKRPQPFKTEDFCFYREGSSDATISAEVAAVALDLRRENRCPELILAAWPDVVANASPDARPPQIRALHSEDGAVWVLAPRFEPQGIRGGLVAVRGERISGKLQLRELDRPMLCHSVILPARPGFGWLESNLLLRTP